MKRWHSLPAAVYSLVEQTPGTVLLESSASPSRLFQSPLATLAPVDAAGLASLIEQIERAQKEGLFAAGYFTYECGSCFEPAAQTRPLPPGRPLAWIGIYEHCSVFDPSTGSFLGGEPKDLASFEPLNPADYVEDENFAVELPVGEAEYREQIQAIHEWIRAGDVYQLNYTFPLRLRGVRSSAALYGRLRGRQPVEYGAFLHTQPDHRILSFSPELFFEVEGTGGERHILTRPMKGTARRGRTNAEDAEIAAWLAQDEKNRSENVMIVDLLRNDLGRLCAYGSVGVEDLFHVQRYPTLWQMTSTVSGQLRPGVKVGDLLRALHPSGSITGAPKVRAMQLLAQMEAEPRGVYTGAIGYFSRERSVMNVAIRTLELCGEVGTMGIGSGIVIDSVPEQEYRECRLKAEFLTAAEAPFLLVETMRLEGEYPLLSLHLERLADSAEYFGFDYNRNAVEAVLAEVAADLDVQPRRVRLTLSREGKICLTQELLPSPAADNEELPRVYIATERTDPGDRFFYHKTTNRPLYAAHFRNAQALGYADVLFLNTYEQITEGAISNLLIEHSGRWYTPPASCGLLEGVYRRHLLETRPEIEERVLTIADLRSADAVYLSNAVRGLRKVAVDWNHC